MHEDNIHLTDLALENAAKDIAQELTKTFNKKIIHTEVEHKSDKRRHETDEEYKQAITTDQTRAAKIIGHDGYRIKKMKARRNVAIDTEYVGEERTFIVRGNRENVKATITELESLITSTVRRDVANTNQRPRGGTVCRNYSRGGCRFGSRCFFLHSREHPLDISLESQEERSRSESREGGPRPTNRQRSPVQRERDRSPLVRDAQRRESYPTPRHWEKKPLPNTQTRPDDRYEKQPRDPRREPYQRDERAKPQIMESENYHPKDKQYDNPWYK